jgi:hypothetical protein
MRPFASRNRKKIFSATTTSLIDAAASPSRLPHREIIAHQRHRHLRRRRDLALARAPRCELRQRSPRRELVVIRQPALGGEEADEQIDLRFHGSASPVQTATATHCCSHVAASTCERSTPQIEQQHPARRLTLRRCIWPSIAAESIRDIAPPHERRLTSRDRLSEP